MLALQNLGCHNINFVTPTHVMPQILQALIRAIELGLNIPLVYNTSGYELSEMIHLLDGIIDIYLPDMRYANNEYALRYSSAPHYVELNRDSVKEMFRQTGTATFDEEGIIRRGVIIRHLVLPHDISGTKDTCAFIAKEISTETYISLMSQYFPAFKAKQHPPLDRSITLEEYESAVDAMTKYGIHNGWIQESGGLKRFAGTHIKKNI
jgi:putative pyruvate formate lyase activating enzyme